MSKSYNFPFIGITKYALDSSCQLLVKFYAEPDEQQKNKIITDAPAVITLDLTNFYWLMIDKLEHGIAQRIEDKYGKGKEGLMVLQQEIETWLNHVHQYCPIEIAVQPDYYDEFYAERSDWHKQSMVMAIPLLEKWLTHPEEIYRSHDFEFSHLSIFVKEITAYLYEDKHQILIERSLKMYNPKKYTNRLIDKKDSLTLIQLINEKQSDNEYLIQIMDEFGEYLENVSNIDTRIEYCIYHLTRHLINSEENQLQENYPIKILTIAIHIGIEREDKSFIDDVRDFLRLLITKKAVLHHLAYNTYKRYMETKKWLTALLHYEFMLSLLENEPLADKDYSIYCNALYVLQNDITGFGVQFDRNRRMLSICVPQAQFNPAIYFNAATLYVEMGEYAEALTNFIQYFSSNDKDKKILYEGLMSEKMYEGFREYKNVSSLLNDLRLKIG